MACLYANKLLMENTMSLENQSTLKPVKFQAKLLKIGRAHV